MLALSKESPTPDLMCSYEFVGMCADYLRDVLRDNHTPDHDIRQAAGQLYSAVRTLSHSTGVSEESLWNMAEGVLGR